MENTVLDNFKYSYILMIIIDISIMNSCFCGMDHIKEPRINLVNLIYLKIIDVSTSYISVYLKFIYH